MVPPIFVFLVGALLLVRSLNQCLEPGERFLFVGVLAALLGADHSLSGGEVDRPHPGFYLVYILAPFAAAAEGSKYHLFRIKSVGSHSFAEMEVNKPVFSPYGVSLLRSMPFLTGILLKIYQALGQN